MTLEVEDGTGKSNADALDSLANVQARWTTLGRDYTTPGYTTAQQEQAIRRASTWLSNAFAWKGTRKQARDQALAWPRYDVIDPEGWAVATDSVPIEVRHALAEAAWQELTSAFSLTPVVTPIDQKVLVEVKGIKWQHMSNGGADDAVPVLTALRDLIAGLLVSGAGTGFVGRAVRI